MEKNKIKKKIEIYCLKKAACAEASYTFVRGQCDIICISKKNKQNIQNMQQKMILQREKKGKNILQTISNCRGDSW